MIHEELLRRWKELRDWIEKDRLFLKWRRELDVQLAEFRQDSGACLTGRRLREAGQYYPSRKDDLDPHELQLLKRSFRRRRWQRLAVVGFACLMLLAYACTRAINQVRTLLATPADRVQTELSELAPYRWPARWWLWHEMTAGKTPEDRLRATLAMARFFPSETVLTALHAGSKTVDVNNEDERKNYRLASRQLFDAVGRGLFALRAIELSADGDPTLVTEFVEDIRADGEPARVAAELAEYLEQVADWQQRGYLQYVRCLLLGSAAGPLDDSVRQELQALYQTADDGGVHTAAGWCCASGECPSRTWRVLWQLGRTPQSSL